MLRLGFGRGICLWCDWDGLLYEESVLIDRKFLYRLIENCLPSYSIYSKRVYRAVASAGSKQKQEMLNDVPGRLVNRIGLLYSHDDAG